MNIVVGFDIKSTNIIKEKKKELIKNFYKFNLSSSNKLINTVNYSFKLTRINSNHKDYNKILKNLKM